MRDLGCFVSCAGGLYKAIENGEALGVNTIMLHPSPPQRWITKPFEPDAVDKFNAAKAAAQTVKKVFFHGIYLTNLANPEKQKFHLAKMSLVMYLDLCERINGDGVVFHIGSFKDTDEETGYKQIVEGVNWILEQAPGQSKLMFEIAAGAGNVVGDRFEELRQIYDQVEQKERIQFCLDTQHMFASGYDIVNNLEAVVTEMDTILNISKIGAVHFNDSKTECNSHKDRHENLGDGLIGQQAMSSFLNHPQLQHLPFIMETPALKDVDNSRGEVEKLLAWAK